MNVAPRFECELPPPVRRKMINPHPPVMINLRIECRMPDFSRLSAKVKRMAGKAWKIVRIPVQVTAFLCIMSALLVGLIAISPGKPNREAQSIAQRALAKAISDFSSPKPAPTPITTSTPFYTHSGTFVQSFDDYTHPLTHPVYTPAPRATFVKNPWPQSENLLHEND